MFLVFSKAFWLRTVIPAWLMIWMVAVPLVHVHPEADHRHGNSGHVHGGIIHTVLSPDLECEYAARVHDETCRGAAHHHLQVSGHPGHAFTHPEIEFSLLGQANDRSAGKPGLTVAGSPEVGSELGQRAVSTASSLPVISPIVLFLSTALPLRAPPFPSI